MKLSKKIVSFVLMAVLLLSAVSVAATSLPLPNVALSGLPLEETTFTGMQFTTDRIVLTPNNTLNEAIQTTEGQNILKKYTVKANVVEGFTVEGVINMPAELKLYHQNAIKPTAQFLEDMATKAKSDLYKDWSTGTGVVVTKNESGNIQKEDGTSGITKLGAYRYNINMYLNELLYDKVNQQNSVDLSNIQYTLVPPASGLTFEIDDSVPQGSFVLNAGQMVNYLSSDYATQWDGPYNTTDSSFYVRNSSKATVDGPYTVFKAPYSGEFQIWAQTKGGASRNVVVDISGDEFTFVPTESGAEMIKGDKTVQLTKGQEVYVRNLAESNVYARSWGFIFIPASYTGTVSTGANVATTWNNGVTGSAITFDTVPVTVTVNDNNAVSAVAGSAVSKYYNLKMYTVDKKSVIKTPTVLDAIIAADAEDDTYALTADTHDANWAITAGTFADGKLTGLNVLVNGQPCTALDQTLVKAGDVIDVGVPSAKNFAPVKLTSTLIYGEGALNKTSDAVATQAGMTAGTKLTIRGNSSSNAAQGANGLTTALGFDCTTLNALQGAYLNGYVKMVDNTNTDHDESEAYIIFRDVQITHHADRQLGFENGLTLASTGNTITINGNSYNTNSSGNYLGNKYLETGTASEDAILDVSGLYLTNSKSMAPLKVTATETENGFLLTTNKTVPVKVIKVAQNGAVTTEWYLLDFMGEGVSIDAEEGDTIYVWQAERVIDSYTTMKPLCAPQTKQ